MIDWVVVILEVLDFCGENYFPFSFLFGPFTSIQRNINAQCARA